MILNKSSLGLLVAILGISWFSGNGFTAAQENPNDESAGQQGYFKEQHDYLPQQPSGRHGYGNQPPSRPHGYGNQPPSVPYGYQPPSDPYGYGNQSPNGPYGYGNQPPSGSYGYQPPSGPYGYGNQPPSGPYGYQPPSGPYGYGYQPPRVPYGYQPVDDAQRCTDDEDLYRDRPIIALIHKIHNAKKRILRRIFGLPPSKCY